MHTDYSDRYLLKIFLFVLLAHSFFLGYSVWMQESSSKRTPPPAPRLIVQTISLSPQIVAIEERAEVVIETPLPPLPEPIPIPIEEPISIPQSQSLPPAPKKKEPPKKDPPKKIEPKKEPIKKEPAKKPPPKPKKTEEVKKTIQSPLSSKPPQPPKPPQPSNSTSAEKAAALAKKEQEAAQEVERVRRQALLSKAQDSIGKIPIGNDRVVFEKSVSQVTTPSLNAITSLQIEALPTGNSVKLSDHEISYRDELAGRLKLLLRLPEYGEVKVKLTISRLGKVVKIIVMHSESEVNRKYIEKSLASLVFPQFGARFANAEEYTFSVTLGNE